jgi:hypothetical protein
LFLKFKTILNFEPVAIVQVELGEVFPDLAVLGSEFNSFVTDKLLGLLIVDEGLDVSLESADLFDCDGNVFDGGGEGEWSDECEKFHIYIISNSGWNSLSI